MTQPPKLFGSRAPQPAAIPPSLRTDLCAFSIRAHGSGLDSATVSDELHRGGRFHRAVLLERALSARCPKASHPASQALSQSRSSEESPSRPNQVPFAKQHSENSFYPARKTAPPARALRGGPKIVSFEQRDYSRSVPAARTANLRSTRFIAPVRDTSHRVRDGCERSTSNHQGGVQ